MASLGCQWSIFMEPTPAQRFDAASEIWFIEQFEGSNLVRGLRLAKVDPEHTLESGESLRQFSTRVVTAVEALAAPHVGGVILVVTHGGVLDCLRRHATGLALDAHRTYTLLNASLNTFSVAGSMWALVDWGDVSHLGLRDSIDDV